MSWEVGVGIAAVVVSIAGLVLKWRHDRESRRTEEKERQRQERARKAAELSAELVAGHAPGPDPKAIAVRNTGKATARNVRVFIDGVPAQEYEEAVSKMCPEPGGSLSRSDSPLYIPLHLSGQAPDRLPVRVLWDDDLGTDRSREFSLSTIL